MSTVATIDLSGFTGLLQVVINVLFQYAPIIIVVGIIIGIVTYLAGGFGNIVNALTGLFGGG